MNTFRLRGLLLSTTIALWGAIPATSTTLFTTGTSGINTNSPGTAASLVAVPFTLSARSTVETATFYELIAATTNFNYYIFADGGFYPASTPLAQGVGQNVTTSVFTELFGVLSVNEIDFSLAAPVTLNAGKYWLAINKGSAEWIALAGDPGSLIVDTSGGSFGSTSDWTLNFLDPAFSIGGVLGDAPAVPEPSYWPLLLFGAVCISGGAIKRRRRVSHAS